MSAATAPTEERPAVQQPEATTLYLSARRGLRLVKKASVPIRNQMGEQVDVSPSERIDFSDDSTLRVPTDRDTEVELPTGVRITAGEIHDFLQGHKVFGDKNEGFWLSPQVAPAITKAELDTVLDMALKLDEDGLTRLVAQEKAGYDRTELVQAAEGALAKLQQMKKDAAVSAAAKAKPGPKPKDVSA